jgi:pimeloyl-ACP methyl ester carboxylesterase
MKAWPNGQLTRAVAAYRGYGVIPHTPPTRRNWALRQEGNFMPLTSRLLTAGLAALVLAGTLAVPAAAATPRPTVTAAAAKSAKTTATEARRVDRVKTPKLRWYRCYGWAQCATAKVPLDYDRPWGKQTTLALLRVKASDQKHKIGSLFVNPGGPGGSATTFALLAPLFLSDALVKRFDIVGMDPRGVGFSDNVRCFGSAGAQTRALKGMEPLFPVGGTQEQAYIKAAKTLGKACATTGRTLAGSMSTAEVARDMDVMRRAVGDRQLNYLGFSYGSALGQYYADMFPDRFRTLAVDGTINPRAWAGTRKSANVIQDERLRSADGAYRALDEILKRCERAGTTRCEFAGRNVPQKFRTITGRLLKKPFSLGPLKITYADFVGAVLGALYSPSGSADIAALSAQLWTLTSPGTPAAKATAAKAYTKRVGRSFPYDNSIDAYASVLCTDGLHPARAASWPKMAAEADKRAPYFGRAWAWSSAFCAGDSWKVHDEDAYAGPFTRRTKNTVLIVGSYWDPATNYAGAVQSAKLLPNSRLLSSNNWGHTAYGTSSCADKSIDQYLLYRDLPAEGTVCTGDDQPFTTTLSAAVTSTRLDLSTAGKAEIAARGLPPAGTPKQLPPVATVR